MAGGKGKIHEHPVANTNGFSRNPQNINRKGRPVSIKAKLKDLLESEGNLLIPASQVVMVKEDGSVVLKVPTEMQLAMKLSSWAMSKKGGDSLKAIQMIMDHIDGKPDQYIKSDMKVNTIQEMEMDSETAAKIYELAKNGGLKV